MLRVQPPGLERWHGPYLNHDVVNDPWEHPYIYRFPGIQHPGGFDLLSTGPDGIKGTRDDITNW